MNQERENLEKLLADGQAESVAQAVELNESLQLMAPDEVVKRAREAGPWSNDWGEGSPNWMLFDHYGGVGFEEVRELDLSSLGESRGLEVLAHFPKLERLSLAGWRSLEDVDGLAVCANLKALDLSNCESLKSLGGLKGLGELKELDLRGCLLIDFEAAYLRGQVGDLSKCMRLFEAFGGRIEEGEGALADVPAIESLAIGLWRFCTDLTFLERYPNLHGLTCLKLMNSSINSLKGLEVLRELEELQLQENGYGYYVPLTRSSASVVDGLRAACEYLDEEEDAASRSGSLRRVTGMGAYTGCSSVGCSHRPELGVAGVSGGSLKDFSVFEEVGRDESAGAPEVADEASEARALVLEARDLEDWSSDSPNWGLLEAHGGVGFEDVTELDLSLEQSCELESVDVLGGLKNLRSLTLRHQRALQDVDGLAGIAGLEALDVAHCTALKSLSGLEGLAKLKGLDLSGCEALDFALGLYVHRRYGRDERKSWISDGGHVFGGAASEVVKTSVFEVLDRVAEPLPCEEPSLLRLANLEVLSLGGWTFVDDFRFLQDCAGLKELRVLSLRNETGHGAGFGNGQGWMSLVGLSELKNLERLDLWLEVGDRLNTRFIEDFEPSWNYFKDSEQELAQLASEAKLEEIRGGAFGYCAGVEFLCDDAEPLWHKYLVRFSLTKSNGVEPPTREEVAKVYPDESYEEVILRHMKFRFDNNGDMSGQKLKIADIYMRDDGLGSMEFGEDWFGTPDPWVVVSLNRAANYREDWEDAMMSRYVVSIPGVNDDEPFAFEDHNGYSEVVFYSDEEPLEWS